MTRRARWAVCAALVAASAWGSTAHAQASELSQRRMGVQWRDGVPHISFSARDLVTPGVRDRLDSSLPQRLVMRMYAYRANGQPITVAARSCRVLHDTWERDYIVDVEDERSDQTWSYRTRESVIRRCLVADHVPIGTARDYRDLSGESIYFAVMVELNPISSATIQRIRRWLASSGGGRGEDGFYGPMVSVFVNRRIGSAERTLQFRSQSIRVPR